MAIVLRQTKGAPLTYAEGDGNFSELDTRTSIGWAMDGLEPTLREGFGNPAELSSFIGNTTAYAFVENATSETFLSWDVPLNWVPGTDLYAAIHWSPGNSTATGSVRWGLEFTTAPVNGVFGATQAFYVVGSADGIAYKHFQSVSAPYPGAAVVKNQRFLIRAYRDGADAADTFPATAYLIGIDFYYQVGSFGTPSFVPPFT